MRDIYEKPHRGHLPREPGIYVLYEDGQPLYVGRTGKGQAHLRQRVGEHCLPGSDQNLAPLARQLACERIGVERGSAEVYATNDFKKALELEKRRVSEMCVNWVTESDPDCRYLLEFYAAKKLRTPYNDFRET